MLRSLLAEGGRGNTAGRNISGKAPPWHQMKVNEADCVACAICVSVCPTGAITKTFENDQIVRHLDSSVCTNCSLCEATWS